MLLPIGNNGPVPSRVRRLAGPPTGRAGKTQNVYVAFAPLTGSVPRLLHGLATVKTSHPNVTFHIAGVERHEHRTRVIMGVCVARMDKDPDTNQKLAAAALQFVTSVNETLFEYQPAASAAPDAAATLLAAQLMPLMNERIFATDRVLVSA